jgi:hypothetical protein
MLTAHKRAAPKAGVRRGSQARPTRQGHCSTPTGHDDAQLERGWSGPDLLYCSQFLRLSSPQGSCPPPQQLDPVTQGDSETDKRLGTYTQQDFAEDVKWALGWHQLFVTGCDRVPGVC